MARHIKSSPPSSIRCKESGFGLVELLVVIGIIAILTAIAVPAFLSQRQKSNDATLRADVKNFGTLAQAAMLDYGSGAALLAQAGVPATYSTIYLNNDSGVRVLPAGVKYWNDTAGLPKINYSKGTYIEFVHMPIDIPAARWVKHEPNEFCLFTSHSNGDKFNWKPSSEAWSDRSYERNLYYDVKLGGLVDAKQLSDAVRGKSDTQAAAISSCHGYGLRYIAAGG